MPENLRLTAHEWSACQKRCGRQKNLEIPSYLSFGILKLTDEVTLLPKITH